MFHLSTTKRLGLVTMIPYFITNSEKTLDYENNLMFRIKNEAFHKYPSS
jgi:hypothetical protein